MATHSQLSTTKPKKQKQKQTNQTIRTGTDSQKWRSHGGLSAGRGREENGEKVQGIRSIKSRYTIDREVKSSMGNGEAKELVCMSHGHELRVGPGIWGGGWKCWRDGSVQGSG